MKHKQEVRQGNKMKQEETKQKLGPDTVCEVYHVSPGTKNKGHMTRVLPISVRIIGE